MRTFFVSSPDFNHRTLFGRMRNPMYRDLEDNNLKAVFAGDRCVMAITEDGRTLQVTGEPSIRSNLTEYDGLRSIAVSSCNGCYQIGLKEDGTCIASDPGNAANQIAGWSNIVQVAVSDAYFALDACGRVHFAPIETDNPQNNAYTLNEYREVTSWRNVRRIVTGLCDCVFGITDDGRILCTGGNITAHSGMAGRLAEITDAVDLYPTGAECTAVFIASRSGIITELGDPNTRLETIPLQTPGERKLLDGNCWYNLVYLSPEQELMHYQYGKAAPVFPGSGPIGSFAVNGEEKPFVIALSE